MSWPSLLAILIIAVGYFALEMTLPINHDVAWLMDAGARWMAGERLYVDLIEVNPPLIFWVYALLTAGTFAKPALIGSVIGLMVVSSLWTARLGGWRAGLAAFVVSIGCGVLDFGQRDHLAAIVAFPYLFADQAKGRERLAIGAFAFIGFGLKPFLLLVPIGATIGRMALTRNWRAALTPENWMLGGLGVVYVVATALIYPEFFSSMIPLGQLVYFAYGANFGGRFKIPLLMFAIVVALVALMRPKHWPIAGALIGAIASYFIQGRFWSYHLVPAVALSWYLFLQVRRPASEREHSAWLAIMLGAAALMIGAQRRHYEDPIPPGATTVLFLSSQVTSAYPSTYVRGVRHASHYPALWTLPGAWRLIRDPATDPARRRQAHEVMDQTRRTIVDDIVRYCPDPILVDIRSPKPNYGSPFDFIAFVEADPRFTGYVAGERTGIFRLYRRSTPCAPR